MPDKITRTFISGPGTF